MNFLDDPNETPAECHDIIEIPNANIVRIVHDTRGCEIPIFACNEGFVFDDRSHCIPV